MTGESEVCEVGGVVGVLSSMATDALMMVQMKGLRLGFTLLTKSRHVCVCVRLVTHMPL